MGLMPGQNVTLETLLYGMMLSSGNDAAIAIAKHVGRLRGALRRDDEREGEGDGPAGTPSSRIRTAWTRTATTPAPTTWRSWPATACRTRRSTASSNTRHWNGDGFDLWNLNKLLPVYPGADGVKPGFTDAAGRCLVGSAVRDNHRVIVTVLNSADTTGDSRALLDYAFDSFRWPS